MREKLDNLINAQWMGKKRKAELIKSLLDLYNVSNQKELLTNFMEYLESIPEFPETDTLIENYLVEGGL